MSTQSSSEKISLGWSFENSSEKPKFAIKTEPAVQYVLANTDRSYVSERRVQAILFFAEVNWLDENNNPLLDATFEKVRQGVYSSEIRKAFESLRLRSRRAYQDGYRTRKFDTRPVDPPNLDEVEGSQVDKAIRMLEVVLNDVKDIPEDALMEWCLDTTGVKSLNSGATIELDSIPG